MRERATEDEQKKEIMLRLFQLWIDNPQLRFMQLLGNVYRGDGYHTEDYDMIEALEKVYRKA